ncbi:MAG TPA: divalent metal cation transporter, partial [Ktedonobacterales bacterium]|nr:divalent metal cation transporter [Ktedonobacterales bacterium]
VVEKGAIFKKELTVPAERIVSTAPDPQRNEDNGDARTLTIATNDQELDALAASGAENLTQPGEADGPANSHLLGQVEEDVPTAEGLRRKEGRSARRRRQQRRQKTAPPPVETPAPAAAPESAPVFSVKTIGPGFLAGMAGNDASAVTSYSINGATNGYGQLWLMLLSTPLLQAVQYSCARIGRVTQQGLAELLRTHYGRKVAIPASLILIVANIALITADLVAIGAGLQLITGLPWEWFVVPVAAILWYLTVYQSFAQIKRIFLVLSLAFIAYLITGFFSGADWGAVLKNTFVPQIGFSFASISAAVALLGATVSPYTMFWQVQGEKEEQRGGTTKHQVRAAAADIAAGTLSGNLIAYFIIVCTSATLFTHHRQITTAADAASALAPLVGPFAKYLFAIGLIGAGVVAIPVLLASTSYAVAGTIGWPASLWKKPWQNEGFYLILTVALVVSLVLALLRLDPIQLMFWANVLQGVLSPVLVVFLLLVGNNRTIMRRYRLGHLTNAALIVTALVMFAASALLFYGLITGQGG